MADPLIRITTELVVAVVVGVAANILYPHGQRAAAAELRAAAPRLAEIRLTPAATGLLLDLIARSLAAAAPGFTSVSGADDDLGIHVTLTRDPGSRTLIRGADGDFALDELSIAIGTTASDDTGLRNDLRQEAG